MTKPSFLRFKSKYYVLLLGFIHLIGLSFIFGCSSNGNNNTFDSLKKINEIRDSISKDKQKKDSITQIKHIQDSIARVDSINKTKKNKNHYNPVTPKCMYGTLPNFDKK